VKLPDGWSRATPVFDDENLVSGVGLVPLMGLAEQAGLSALIEDKGLFLPPVGLVESSADEEHA